MAKKRAFARYTTKGELVPGSMIITTKGGYPDKISLWKEVPVWYNDVINCPEPDYGEWEVVTGGIGGDGLVLNDDGDPNLFTIVGPGDGANDGWVYLKRYFPLGAVLNINYKWTSFDVLSPNPPDVDWPVYWSSPTEPTGIPTDLTIRVPSTPDNGTWNITVSPGEWFGIGIYSDDSCCGRGFLSVDFNL
jgi:hypothetical protein